MNDFNCNYSWIAKCCQCNAPNYSLFFFCSFNLCLLLSLFVCILNQGATNGMKTIHLLAEWHNHCKEKKNCFNEYISSVVGEHVRDFEFGAFDVSEKCWMSLH